MANSELLEFLQKYVHDPRVLSDSDIDADLRDALPAAWLELLGMDQSARVKAVIELWQPFRAEFQQVIAYFRKYLESINLISSSRGLTLLYGIRAQSGGLMYYGGKPPLGDTYEQSLGKLSIKELWPKTPDALQKFYRELHNGWSHFVSESMGLSALERVFVLSREDWGILDELEELPVDLNRSLAIFSNGMGDYVCQELLDKKTKTFLWHHDKPPKLDLEFWPVVDSWTTIGFEA